MRLRLSLVLPLLFLSADICAEKVCSTQDVVDHLNLTTNRDALTWSRPVRDWTTPTIVYLDIIVYAILAVNEKSQTFVSVLWIVSTWENKLISWDPKDFCGIQQIVVPQDLLWKPDLLIYENMEKEGISINPYLVVKYDGTVLMDTNTKVLSTCAMDVRKFPFDTQRCNLTFSSAAHTDKDIQLVPGSNSSRTTKMSQEYMQSRGEWEFLNVSVQTVKLFFQEHGSWDQVIYTITIRRAPLLQVLTFILPILFLLALDLVSFFMADTRGDKLCFKVTVLLAMSVLLLVLTDTLPSKPNKTPLIAVFVTVVFAFMLLSVLETVLVLYLMERASSHGSQRGRSDSPDRPDGICSRAPSFQGLHQGGDTGSVKSIPDCMSNLTCPIYNRKSAVSGCMGGLERARGVHQLETLPMTPDPHEADSEVPEARCIGHLLRLILQELRKHPHDPALDHVQAWYQNTVIRPINTIFFVFYLISVSIFLLFLFLDWVYW